MKLKILNIEEHRDQLNLVSAPVPKSKLMFAYKLGKQMLELLDGVNSVGLSAPQVGVTERILVVKVNRDSRIMINPKIVLRTQRKIKSVESCLSFPEKDAYLLDRAEGVKVSYQDGMGNIRLEQFFGPAAVVIQHEMDHLNGTTMDKEGTKLETSQPQPPPNEPA
jgi:peptide deformylase